MITWSGLGFLVPLVALVCLAFTELLFDGIYGKDFYSTHDWAIAAGLFFAAAGCWVLGKLLGRQPPRVLTDKATGQEVKIQRWHTLMAIPVRYWSAIVAVIGLIYFIKGFVK